MAVPEAVASRADALNQELPCEDGLDDLSSIRLEFTPEELERALAKMRELVEYFESICGPSTEEEIAAAERELAGDA